METIAELIATYRYAILFPLAFFEGPIVSFVVGVFVAAGYFDPLVAYPIMILGDIVPDTIAYAVGRYGDPKKLVDRFGRWIGLDYDHVERFRRLWYRHGFKTMFFSKIAYGLSTALLVSAGLVDLPLKRFLFLAIPVTFGQYAVLMAAGYYFGASFHIVDAAVETVGIAITVTILFSIAYYLVSRRFRARILAEASKDENGDGEDRGGV